MPPKRPIKKAARKSPPTTITKNKVSLSIPRNIFLYGKAGVGKTSLAARMGKNCLFIRSLEDRGVEVLARQNLIPKPVEILCCDCWDVISNNYGQISGQQPLLQILPNLTNLYDFDTLVLDSLTGFERMCFQYVTLKDYQNNDAETNKGFYSYGNGPIKTAAREWPDFLLLLSGLLNLGKSVIVIGHRTKVSVEYPGQQRFERWQPLLNKHIWERTYAWAEDVLYIEDSFDVVKEQGSLQAKAAADMKGKLLYTQETPRFDAKNQLSMPPVIDLGQSADEAAAALKGYL